MNVVRAAGLRGCPTILLRLGCNRDRSFGEIARCVGEVERYRKCLAYDLNMDRNVVYITEAEAIREIASVLARVEKGAEVVVKKDDRAVAVIHRAPETGRLLSECLALAEAHGSTVTLDEGFESDLMDVIESRNEPLEARWD